MAPKRASRSRSRQTTPQSPPKQLIPQPSPLHARKSPRITGHDRTSVVQQKPAQSQLAVVDEEQDSESEIEVVQPGAPSDVDPTESANSSIEPSDDDIHDSSSNGTTQLEALDTDLIIDNLPLLYQTARQVLSLFDPQRARASLKGLKDPASRASKRLANFVNQLNFNREAYVDGNYIDVQLILRKLTNEMDIRDGPWRPDAILQLANLAYLLTSLVQNDDQAVYDTLENMFHRFPDPFGPLNTTSDMARYHTSLVKETVLFGVDLRTQFFFKVVDVTLIDPAFDPDDILKQVFLDENGTLDIFQVESARLPAGVAKAMMTRFNKIRKCFSVSSRNSVDLTQLKRKHPWETFLADAIQWVTLRKEELETQIQAQGGIEAIRQRLEQREFDAYKNDVQRNWSTMEVEEAPDETHNVPQPMLSNITPVQPSSSRPSGMSTMAARVMQLKNIQAQQDDLSSESDKESEKQPQTPQKGNLPKSPPSMAKSARTEIPQSPDAEVEMHGPLTGADDQLLDGDDEQDELEEGPLRHSSPPPPPTATQSSVVPTQQTLAVLAAAREQNMIGNKENAVGTKRRYVDKQRDAKRIEWDETQTGGKRSRDDFSEDVDGEDNNDDDEDDDFETNARPRKRLRSPQPIASIPADERVPVDADDDDDVDDDPDKQPSPHRRRTRTPPARSSRLPPSTHPPFHRSPLQELHLPRVTRPPSSSAPQQQQQQRRQPTPDTVPPEVEAEAEAEAHATVNVRAKATMRLHPLLDAKAQQVRRPWSPAETARLFEMIASHGCHWAFILSEDHDHPDGPALQARNQVQLKDKARNLKMDYLKAGARLPDGFSGVTIKKSDRELLDVLGMPYVEV